MNILVVTPYFPSFDIFRERSEDPRTKFLYDYSVEWAKAGHSVLVIHTIPKYPVFYPWLVRCVESIPGGMRLQLNRFIQDPATLQASDYVSNGIHIIRIPVPKYIPHRDFWGAHIRKLKRQIDDTLKSLSWRQDIIFSDFLSPSLDLACDIKGNSAVPVFQIFHQSDLRYFKMNRSCMQERLGRTSGVLFRSYSIKGLFERSGLHIRYYDYMFSGIPVGTRLGDCRRKVIKFLYVGTLRYSKNVHLVIQAFAKSSISANCSLEIIGTGPDEDEMKQLPQTLGIAKYVTFSGKVSRETVLKKMSQSDCLVMVSRETFGMVYIEAMSQGCIVIAARGEGIDGIVVDGENGFLVPLGDMETLAATIQKVSMLDGKEVSRISQNAITTASKMKDDVLANDLLERLQARNPRVKQEGLHQCRKD